MGDNIIVLSDTRIKNVKNYLRVDSVNVNKTGTIDLGIEGISNLSIDTTSSNYPDFKRNLGSEQNFINVSDSVWNDKVNKIVYFHYQIELADLMNTLIHDALFNDYLIVDTSKILFRTQPSGFHYVKYDSLLDTTLGMQVSSIRNIEINGVVYKLFLQPFQLDPHNNWILGGLINTDKYNGLRKAIPQTWITLLFFVALLTILSLPFLKLLFMGSTEQLYLSDAMYAGITIILGSSIIVMLLFNIQSKLNDRKEREKTLTAFGTLISERFRTEIEEAYAQLMEFDTLYQDKFDLVNISQDGSTVRQESDDSTEINYAAKKYPLFTHLYWIDNNGNQKVKWTTRDKNSPKIDVSKREYFKRVFNNEEWNMDNDSIRIGFESIYSWNSGEALVGISKKSINTHVAVIAMATAFYSVIDPIIPEGYGFAIINKSAEVLFHSDKNKNLQENFLTETENNNHLRAALYARKDDCFNINYSGDTYGVYIQPIRDLPLFVIAFKNLSKERSVRAQTMNFTFILILGYFLCFAFMALFTRILKKPGSKLKKISYLFGWLFPRKNKEQLYFDTFVMQAIFVLFILVFTICCKYGIFKILILVTGSIYTFLFTFLSLNGFTGKAFFRKENIKYLISAFFLFIILTFISLKIHYWPGILFQLILFVVYSINFGKFINIPAYYGRKVYILMLLSWLCITSIIPAIFFYKISYQHEHKLAIKHDQLAMARIITLGKNKINDTARIRYFFSRKSTINNLKARKDIYPLDFDSLIFIKINIKKDSLLNTYNDPDTSLNKVASNLRAIYNDFDVESRDLTYNEAKDTLWRWSANNGPDTIVFYYKNNAFKDPIVMESSLTGLNSVTLNLSIIFILLIIALYYLIKFSVARIFFDIKEDRLSLKDECKLFKKRPPDNRILLIGLSDPEKRICIETIFEEKYIHVDLEQIEKPDYLPSKIEQKKINKDSLIILDHLEYKIEDKDLTDKKLDLINDLVNGDEVKIVVTTSMELSHFEEVLSDKTEYSNIEIEQVMNRLMRVFSSFYQVYCPLQGESDEKKSQGHMHAKITLMESMWQTEFEHGTYLAQLKPKLKSITDNIKTKKDNELYDQTILNIRHLADPYYTSLWANCTKKEKYVLHDLADDGVVNPRNTKTITKLLNKGLFIYTDKLSIMNESFRNFVLTGLNPEEAQQLRKEARAAGYWGKFRNPILIMLAAIVIFLFITQKETVNSFISFLAPVVAIVPVMIRAFSAISTSKVSLKKPGQD